MIKYNEWLTDTLVDQEDGVLDNQLEQMVARVAGLVHGVSETKKNALVKKFIQQIEEQILGEHS